MKSGLWPPNSCLRPLISGSGHGLGLQFFFFRLLSFNFRLRRFPARPASFISSDSDPVFFQTPYCTQAPPPKRDRFRLAPAHAPAGGAGVWARGGGGGPAARRRRRTRGRSPASLCVCDAAPMHRTRKPREAQNTEA